MKREHGLSEKEMELVKLLMADCHNTGDIKSMLKWCCVAAIRILDRQSEHIAKFTIKPSKGLVTVNRSASPLLVVLLSERSVCHLLDRMRVYQKKLKWNSGFYFCASITHRCH